MQIFISVGCDGTPCYSDSWYVCMYVHLLYHGLSEGQGLASVWLRTKWNELRWPYLPCTVSHEYGHERGDNDVCKLEKSRIQN